MDPILSTPGKNGTAGQPPQRYVVIGHGQLDCWFSPNLDMADDSRHHLRSASNVKRSLVHDHPQNRTEKYRGYRRPFRLQIQDYRDHYGGIG